MRYIKILFWNFFFIGISIFFSDNIINLIGSKPKKINTFFEIRHSSNYDVFESPPLNYQKISNENLYLKPVKFRTSNDLGDVLPRGGTGKCKIYFIGGSTTESHWIPEKQRWVYLTGQQIKNKVTSYNFGVGGYNSFQNSIKLQSFLLKDNFDTLVFINQINDISKFIQSNFSPKFYHTEANSLHGTYTRKKEENFSQRLRLAAEKLLPSSTALWRNSRNRSSIKTRISIKKVKNQSLEFKNKFRDIFIPKYINIIKNNANLLKQYNVNLVIGIQPNRINFITEEKVTNDLDHLKKQLNKAGINIEDLNWAVKELRDAIISIKHDNILVISSGLKMEKNSKNFYDFIHYSPKGSLEFSSLIASELDFLISSNKICNK